MRSWYKKGESRIRRPHGISETTYRSGDGWNWLSEHYEYLDQVKEQMKNIRRKTAFTYSSEYASSQKQAKIEYFRTQAKLK
jgi:hypothetical protein